MVSERLTYRVVAPSDLGAFVSLVQDEHTRRYMMDGVLHSPEWCAERIRESEVLFERRARVATHQGAFGNLFLLPLG